MSTAERPDRHLGRRPDGVSDEVVEATGKVSEALEFVERARGHLYSFHQLIGHADLLLGDACDILRAAGRSQAAERLQGALVGRNVLEDRWTFQVVEEFDDGYWSVFRDHEQRLREDLLNGARHVFEAEMKEIRRGRGSSGRTARP